MTYRQVEFGAAELRLELDERSDAVRFARKHEHRGPEASPAL